MRGGLYAGWVYVLTALAILAAPLTTGLAVSSWKKREVLREALQEAQRRAVAGREFQERLSEAARFLRRSEEVLGRARGLGLTSASWVRRRVDVERREMSRDEAEGMLAGVGRDEGYVFVPEAFSLGIVQQGDDLFHFRSGDADRLRLTLKGLYLIRDAGT